jgi:hypothetical protein
LPGTTVPTSVGAKRVPVLILEAFAARSIQNWKRFGPNLIFGATRPTAPSLRNGVFSICRLVFNPLSSKSKSTDVQIFFISALFFYVFWVFFFLPFLFFFGQKNICSHGNEKYTTCIGGWSHNQSQCQRGYDGVLCGTCSSEVDIYTVVEESTVDSGNGTNSSSSSSSPSNSTDGTLHTRTYRTYWMKRDRSSFVVTKPSPCIQCTVDVSPGTLTSHTYRALWMTGCVAVGFVVLVFYLLLKPAAQYSSAFTKGTKVTPTISGTVPLTRSTR